MNTNIQQQRIIDIALFAGKTILENGAETYRVEETIKILCLSKAIEEVNCFCVPTGIFLSVAFDSQEYTFVRRIKNSRIDLEVISMVNDFSRRYVNHQITDDEAYEQLKTIADSPKFPMPIRLFFAGVAGGFFAMMFNGNWIDCSAAFIVSLLTMALLDSHNFKIRSYFIKHVLGGMTLAALTIFIHYIYQLNGLPIHFDNVIIGSLMPLVPGVAFTNALRDTISGDYLSGVSKLSEAMAIAVAIAIGVGGVLNFRFF